MMRSILQRNRGEYAHKAASLSCSLSPSSYDKLANQTGQKGIKHSHRMSLDLFSIFPLTVGVRLNVLKSNRKGESEILICQSACSLRGGGAQVVDIPR